MKEMMSLKELACYFASRGIDVEQAQIHAERDPVGFETLNRLVFDGEVLATFNGAPASGYYDVKLLTEALETKPEPAAPAIDDGGPAFPLAVPDFHGDAPHIQHGLSLRDWFAGQALSGILAKAIHPNSMGNDSPNWASTASPGPEAAARMAYQYADAMLAARKGGRS